MSPSDLKAAGVPASASVDTSVDTIGDRQGYIVSERKMAEYLVGDLKSAGCQVSYLATAGYTFYGLKGSRMYNLRSRYGGLFLDSVTSGGYTCSAIVIWWI